jgi:hypothetical protein
MDYQQAAEVAADMGLDITAADITAHLKNHRWIQPAPQGNLRRGAALAKVRALPNERLRHILLLLSRVKGLSGTQIAEAVYWNGDDRRLHSQRNQCYRDLRKLLYADLIYRLPAGTTRPTGNLRRLRQDQQMLYFLGRDAAPYVEERDGYQLGRKDWVTRPDQLGDEYRVLLAHEATEIPTTLLRQMKSVMAGHGKASLMGSECTITFSPLNWWAGTRAALHFEEPISGMNTVSPGGIAALGLEIPARQLSTMTPFFYEHDAGLRNPTRYAEHLLSYLALSRTPALSERYPDLPSDGYTPPTAIVCRDPRRVPMIQREAQQLISRALLGDERPPVLVVTDETTFRAHGLTGECWLSLWDTEARGRRMSLLEVLLRGSMPLLQRAQHLSADSELLCDQRGAVRQRSV